MLLFFLLFFVFLVFFCSWVSDFLDNPSESKSFLSILDIISLFSHFFEPIFMQRLYQNLNSDFFISINIRKRRQNTIHRICFKSLICLDRMNAIFSQRELSSSKKFSCFQEFWLFNLLYNSSDIKRRNHLFYSHEMFLWYSEEKFNHLFFNNHFHTDCIIPKPLILPAFIKDCIKIFVDLIHKLNILLHRLNMIFCINIWTSRYRIFRDLNLEKSDLFWLFDSMFFLKMQKNDSPNENSNNSKNSSCYKTYYKI